MAWGKTEHCIQTHLDFETGLDSWKKQDKKHLRAKISFDPSWASYCGLIVLLTCKQKQTQHCTERNQIYVETKDDLGAEMLLFDFGGEQYQGQF